MNQPGNRIPLPLAGLLVTWLIVTAVNAWLLLPLNSNTNFRILLWMPLIALGLGALRWPWRQNWRWCVDSWSVMALLVAAISLAATLVYADPVLTSLASLMLALAVSRGVIADNRRPLRGAWLPLAMPLFLFFGFDERLTRWHDGMVREETIMLLDAMAFPNDGFRTLPTDQVTMSYLLDYSGNPWTSWGILIGLGLIVSAVFRRRGLHGILVAAVGFLWATVANVACLVGPFLIWRFAGPVFPEPLLTESWPFYALPLALILVLSTDQFFRFALSEVESDEDSASLVGQVCRLWNRLTSDELTARQIQRLKRASFHDGILYGCLGVTLLLTLVFAFRAVGFYARELPRLAESPQLKMMQTDDARFVVGDGTLEKCARGSRLGMKTWMWRIGGELGRATLTVNESPSAQRDLLHQVRMGSWRTARTAVYENPPLPGYEWTKMVLEKSNDAQETVRHHGYLLVATARIEGDGQRHPASLIGRFPNWSGKPLIASRWEGRLRQSSVIVWLLAESFLDYTPEELLGWETMFAKFVESLPPLKVGD